MNNNSQPLQLTEGYRASRRNNSLACAIALAWAAVQFDLETLSLSSIGSIDLTNATAPLVLAAIVTYTFLRCMIEYAMQPEPVRRWKLAQIDLRLTVFLVRATALSLGASGLYRSLETVLAVAVVALTLFALSIALWFGGIFVLTPLMIAIRKRQCRHSIASRVIEADAWSRLIVVTFLCVLIIILGAASLYYEPFRLLWPIVLENTAMAIAVFSAIAVVLSIYLGQTWYQKLFALEETACLVKPPPSEAPDQ